MKRVSVGCILIVVSIVCSCSSKESNGAKEGIINIDSVAEAISIIPHKQLVEAKVDYLGSGLDGNYEEHEKSGKKAFAKKETHGSLLIIESYFMRSGCTDYEGNIDIHSDTLVLKLVSNTNISCTELDYYLVTYKISNPEHKKYIIVKE